MESGNLWAIESNALKIKAITYRNSISNFCVIILSKPVTALSLIFQILPYCQYFGGNYFSLQDWSFVFNTTNTQNRNKNKK
jgi:hypothetical protein